MNRAWLFLLIAGLLEIGFALGLKYSEGFSRIGPTIFTAVVAVASFTCLSLALRHIPVSTGYAVWTGIGAAGTAIYGILVLGEPRDLLKVLCLVLIVAGVAGLKYASPH